jgi:uncharacterized protein
MIIELTKIKSEGLHIERVFKSDDIVLHAEEAEIKEPVSIDIWIKKINKRFRFRGSLKSSINMQCARCLLSFKLPVSTTFDLIYAPHQKLSEGEIELKQDDMNISFLLQEQIDLKDIIREQILLIIPMKPLCSPDCRGLCPECGINLNIQGCNCEKKAVDSRLKPLLKIKEMFKSS